MLSREGLLKGVIIEGLNAGGGGKMSFLRLGGWLRSVMLKWRYLTLSGGCSEENLVLCYARILHVKTGGLD